METDEEAMECSFRSLDLVNATFIAEGNRIPVPNISRTTRVGLQLMVGRGTISGRGLGKNLHGGVNAPVMKENFDHFGLGYRPDIKQKEKRNRKKTGFIYPGQRMLKEEGLEARLGEIHINAIDAIERETLLEIRPYEPGGELNNWTAEKIPVVFRARSESPDINDMNNAASDSGSLFEQNICLEGSYDFEDDVDCGESLEIGSLEEGNEVKIGTDITAKTRRDLIELLRKFKDVFAWSYQDMPGLSIDIVVHRLPIREDCKPVQQKLRRMRPDIVLKIKEEVKKQFDAAFLQEVKYSEWVANVDPIPKKDRKMHPEDMRKTTFNTLWGTFCYKVIPFGLKNAGVTYQRAIVTLFHDMMHKEIEFYVDEMIAKSRTEEGSGKLLGFIVSGKGIEVGSDKVRAIRDSPPPHTQKEVQGFLGRLNYIARFISRQTEKCDPIFRLLRKHNPGVWDEECQIAFDKIKQLLSNTPVLLPPSLDRPLILYLAVFDNSMGRMARWKILLSKFDIVYVSQKAVKGSAIADFLASRALEDYEPLNFDFPNEDLMYVAATEENSQMNHVWKLNLDGASNVVGNGIGAVLVSPSGDHYPIASKLDFDCTNNIAEYEACIMGIRVAIERKIKVLKVYGDSALVIYQLKGEWETRDPKLISYRKMVLELIDEFDDITFCYLPRDENQMVDVLATLASMIQVKKLEDMNPIQMSIFETPAHCYNVEEEEKDDRPWYLNILRYVKNREYPDQAAENEKKGLRRMAIDYVLDGEILYKKGKDQ
nr:unnamed protein product [Gossypium raimondii]